MRLASSEGGSYSWTAEIKGSGTTLAHETGTFTLHPSRAAFERTLTDPSRPGQSYVVVMREVGQERYLQMKAWGSWDGCWLQYSARDLASLDGSIGTPAADALSQLDIPQPIATVLGARATGPARPSGANLQADATVTAAIGLQALGVPATSITSDLPELTRLRIPVTVTYSTDGSPLQLDADGSAVADALANGGATFKSLNALRELTGTVWLTGIGRQEPIQAPPADALLPAHASKTDTCAAHR